MSIMYCLNGHYYDDGEPVYISQAAYMRAKLRKARLTPKPAPHCPDCGAMVISACPGQTCKTLLRLGSDSEKAPEYCTGCGEPFPWKVAAEVAAEVAAASVVVVQESEPEVLTVVKPRVPLTRLMGHARSFVSNNGPAIAREAAKAGIDEGLKKLMGG